MGATNATPQQPQPPPPPPQAPSNSTAAAAADDGISAAEAERQHQIRMFLKMQRAWGTMGDGDGAEAASGEQNKGPHLLMEAVLTGDGAAVIHILETGAHEESSFTPQQSSSSAQASSATAQAEKNSGKQQRAGSPTSSASPSAPAGGASGRRGEGDKAPAAGSRSSSAKGSKDSEGKGGRKGNAPPSSAAAPPTPPPQRTGVDRPYGPSGETALHAACRLNHLEMVSALLAAGADPNAADLTGFTALHHAFLGGTNTRHIDAEQYADLLQQQQQEGDDDDDDPLSFDEEEARRIGAEAEGAGVVVLLLRYGADLNAIAIDGTSVLQYAIQQHQLLAARQLLARHRLTLTSATRAIRGETPLSTLLDALLSHFAVQHHNPAHAAQTTEEGLALATELLLQQTCALPPSHTYLVMSQHQLIGRGIAVDDQLANALGRKATIFPLVNSVGDPSGDGDAAAAFGKGHQRRRGRKRTEKTSARRRRKGDEEEAAPVSSDSRLLVGSGGAATEAASGGGGSLLSPTLPFGASAPPQPFTDENMGKLSKRRHFSEINTTMDALEDRRVHRRLVLPTADLSAPSLLWLPNVRPPVRMGAVAALPMAPALADFGFFAQMRGVNGNEEKVGNGSAWNAFPPPSYGVAGATLRRGTTAWEGIVRLPFTIAELARMVPSLARGLERRRAALREAMAEERRRRQGGGGGMVTAVGGGRAMLGSFGNSDDEGSRTNHADGGGEGASQGDNTQHAQAQPASGAKGEAMREWDVSPEELPEAAELAAFVSLALRHVGLRYQRAAPSHSSALGRGARYRYDATAAAAEGQRAPLSAPRYARGIDSLGGGNDRGGRRRVGQGVGAGLGLGLGEVDHMKLSIAADRIELGSPSGEGISGREMFSAAMPSVAHVAFSAERFAATAAATSSPPHSSSHAALPSPAEEALARAQTLALAPSMSFVFGGYASRSRLFGEVPSMVLDYVEDFLEFHRREWASERAEAEAEAKAKAEKMQRDQQREAQQKMEEEEERRRKEEEAEVKRAEEEALAFLLSEAREESRIAAATDPSGEEAIGDAFGASASASASSMRSSSMASDVAPPLPPPSDKCKGEDREEIGAIDEEAVSDAPPSPPPTDDDEDGDKSTSKGPPHRRTASTPSHQSILPLGVGGEKGPSDPFRLMAHVRQSTGASNAVLEALNISSAAADTNGNGRDVGRATGSQRLRRQWWQRRLRPGAPAARVALDAVLHLKTALRMADREATMVGAIGKYWRKETRNRRHRFLSSLQKRRDRRRRAEERDFEPTDDEADATTPANARAATIAGGGTDSDASASSGHNATRAAAEDESDDNISDDEDRHRMAMVTTARYVPWVRDDAATTALMLRGYYGPRVRLPTAAAAAAARAMVGGGAADDWSASMRFLGEESGLHDTPSPTNTPEVLFNTFRDYALLARQRPAGFGGGQQDAAVFDYTSSTAYNQSSNAAGGGRLSRSRVSSSAAPPASASAGLAAYMVLVRCGCAPTLPLTAADARLMLGAGAGSSDSSEAEGDDDDSDDDDYIVNKNWAKAVIGQAKRRRNHQNTNDFGGRARPWDEDSDSSLSSACSDEETINVDDDNTLDGQQWKISGGVGGDVTSSHKPRVSASNAPPPFAPRVRLSPAEDAFLFAGDDGAALSVKLRPPSSSLDSHSAASAIDGPRGSGIPFVFAGATAPPTSMPHYNAIAAADDRRRHRPFRPNLRRSYYFRWAEERSGRQYAAGQQKLPTVELLGRMRYLRREQRELLLKRKEETEGAVGTLSPSSQGLGGMVEDDATHGYQSEEAAATISAGDDPFAPIRNGAPTFEAAAAEAQELGRCALLLVKALLSGGAPPNETAAAPIGLDDNALLPPGGGVDASISLAQAFNAAAGNNKGGTPQRKSNSTTNNNNNNNGGGALTGHNLFAGPTVDEEDGARRTAAALAVADAFHSRVAPLPHPPLPATHRPLPLTREPRTRRNGTERRGRGGGGGVDVVLDDDDGVVSGDNGDDDSDVTDEFAFSGPAHALQPLPPLRRTNASMFVAVNRGEGLIRRALREGRRGDRRNRTQNQHFSGAFGGGGRGEEEMSASDSAEDDGDYSGGGRGRFMGSNGGQRGVHAAAEAARARAVGPSALSAPTMIDGHSNDTTLHPPNSYRRVLYTRSLATEALQRLMGVMRGSKYKNGEECGCGLVGGNGNRDVAAASGGCERCSPLGLASATPPSLVSCAVQEALDVLFGVGGSPHHQTTSLFTSSSAPAPLPSPLANASGSPHGTRSIRSMADTCRQWPFGTNGDGVSAPYADPRPSPFDHKAPFYTEVAGVLASRITTLHYNDCPQYTMPHRAASNLIVVYDTLSGPFRGGLAAGVGACWEVDEKEEEGNSRTGTRASAEGRVPFPVAERPTRAEALANGGRADEWAKGGGWAQLYDLGTAVFEVLPGIGPLRPSSSTNTNAAQRDDAPIRAPAASSSSSSRALTLATMEQHPPATEKEGDGARSHSRPIISRRSAPSSSSKQQRCETIFLPPPYPPRTAQPLANAAYTHAALEGVAATSTALSYWDMVALWEKTLRAPFAAACEAMTRLHESVGAMRTAEALRAQMVAEYDEAKRRSSREQPPKTTTAPRQDNEHMSTIGTRTVAADDDRRRNVDAYTSALRQALFDLTQCVSQSLALLRTILLIALPSEHPLALWVRTYLAICGEYDEHHPTAEVPQPTTADEETRKTDDDGENGNDGSDDGADLRAVAGTGLARDTAAKVVAVLGARGGPSSADPSAYGASLKAELIANLQQVSEAAAAAAGNTTSACKNTSTAAVAVKRSASGGGRTVGASDTTVAAAATAMAPPPPSWLPAAQSEAIAAAVTSVKAPYGAAMMLPPFLPQRAAQKQQWLQDVIALKEMQREQQREAEARAERWRQRYGGGGQQKPQHSMPKELLTTESNDGVDTEAPPPRVAHRYNCLQALLHTVMRALAERRCEDEYASSQLIRRLCEGTARAKAANEERQRRLTATASSYATATTATATAGGLLSTPPPSSRSASLATPPPPSSVDAALRPRRPLPTSAALVTTAPLESGQPTPATVAPTAKATTTLFGRLAAEALHNMRPHATASYAPHSATVAPRLRVQLVPPAHLAQTAPPHPLRIASPPTAPTAATTAAPSQSLTTADENAGTMLTAAPPRTAFGREVFSRLGIGLTDPPPPADSTMRRDITSSLASPSGLSSQRLATFARAAHAVPQLLLTVLPYRSLAPMAVTESHRRRREDRLTGSIHNMHGQGTFFAMQQQLARFGSYRDSPAGRHTLERAAAANDGSPANPLNIYTGSRLEAQHHVLPFLTPSTALSPPPPRAPPHPNPPHLRIADDRRVILEAIPPRLGSERPAVDRWYGNATRATHAALSEAMAVARDFAVMARHRTAVAVPRAATNYNYGMPAVTADASGTIVSVGGAASSLALADGGGAAPSTAAVQTYPSQYYFDNRRGIVHYVPPPHSANDNGYHDRGDQQQQRWSVEWARDEEAAGRGGEYPMSATESLRALHMWYGLWQSNPPPDSGSPHRNSWSHERPARQRLLGLDYSRMHLSEAFLPPRTMTMMMGGEDSVRNTESRLTWAPDAAEAFAATFPRFVLENGVRLPMLALEASRHQLVLRRAREERERGAAPPASPRRSGGGNKGRGAAAAASAVLADSKSAAKGDGSHAARLTAEPYEFFRTPIEFEAAVAAFEQMVAAGLRGSSSPTASSSLPNPSGASASASFFVLDTFSPYFGRVFFVPSFAHLLSDASSTAALVTVASKIHRAAMAAAAERKHALTSPQSLSLQPSSASLTAFHHVASDGPAPMAPPAISQAEEHLRAAAIPDILPDLYRSGGPMRPAPAPCGPPTAAAVLFGFAPNLVSHISADCVGAAADSPTTLSSTAGGAAGRGKGGEAARNARGTALRFHSLFTSPAGASSPTLASISTSGAAALLEGTTPSPLIGFGYLEPSAVEESTDEGSGVVGLAFAQTVVPVAREARSERTRSTQPSWAVRPLTRQDVSNVSHGGRHHRRHSPNPYFFAAALMWSLRGAEEEAEAEAEAEEQRALALSVASGSASSSRTALVLMGNSSTTSAGPAISPGGDYSVMANESNGGASSPSRRVRFRLPSRSASFKSSRSQSPAAAALGAHEGRPEDARRAGGKGGGASGFSARRAYSPISHHPHHSAPLLTAAAADLIQTLRQRFVREQRYIRRVAATQLDPAASPARFVFHSDTMKYVKQTVVMGRFGVTAAYAQAPTAALLFSPALWRSEAGSVIPPAPPSSQQQRGEQQQSFGGCAAFPSRAEPTVPYGSASIPVPNNTEEYEEDAPRRIVVAGKALAMEATSYARYRRQWCGPNPAAAMQSTYSLPIADFMCADPAQPIGLLGCSSGRAETEDDDKGKDKEKEGGGAAEGGAETRDRKKSTAVGDDGDAAFSSDADFLLAQLKRLQAAAAKGAAGTSSRRSKGPAAPPKPPTIGNKEFVIIDEANATAAGNEASVLLSQSSDPLRHDMDAYETPLHLACLVHDNVAPRSLAARSAEMVLFMLQSRTQRLQMEELLL